jgi:AraC-like DNA-binding protein
MSLHYAEHAPSAALARHIECYWTLSGHVPLGGEPQRIIPDGRAELVWNFGDSFVRHGGSSGSHRQPDSVLVGQITTPILLEPTGRIDLLGARFTPAGLSAFIGRRFPMFELTDGDVRMNDILGARLHGFLDDAGVLTPPGARVLLLDERLSRELRNVAQPEDRLLRAVQLIIATHGDVRMDALAATVNVSGRQLERLFMAGVGMGPKRLARISRLQHLLALAGPTGPKPGSWARVALECGYYDQAHLMRDFRELTGQTPGVFFRDTEPTFAEVFLRPG